MRTPWHLARHLAHDAPVPLPPESVPLACAAGLTLAEELHALCPLPAFDTAAMDGYAVSGPGPYRLVGCVLAGQTWAGHLSLGDAVEIATGACVPSSADGVIALEQATQAGTTVSGPTPRQDQHIRRRGEDAAAGATLAPAGAVVSAALLGLAASCGYDALLVRPRPRVRIVFTGDELRHRGLSGEGQVRDALGPMLPPLIADLGGLVDQSRYVKDHPAVGLTDALDDATGEASVVVVTGSTSVGRTDRLHSLLNERGACWVIDGVACRPGHPQLLAQLPDGRWVVGLPGNPFAAWVAAHTLLAPVLAALSGRPLPALEDVLVAGDLITSSD